MTKDDSENTGAGKGALADIGLVGSLARRDPDRAAEIVDSLPDERALEAVLGLRGRDRLEVILASTRAAELARSLPAPEYWLTLKEVGEDDALDLIALGGPDQNVHVTDLECWHEGRLDALAAAYWMTILARAGDQAFIDWFNAADEEFLVAAFSRFFTVFVADPDNAGAEPWRSFKNIWTLDDSYYLHFRDPRMSDSLEAVLSTIRAEEPMKYYGLLDAIQARLLSEDETVAHRFRAARMEDHGFLGQDESLEVYAPLSDREIRELEAEAAGRDGLAGASQGAAGPRVGYPLALADMPDLFARALAMIGDPERLNELRAGIAALANRILMADSMNLSRLESVGESLDKAYSYIELGLRRWSGGDLEAAARALWAQHPIHIFRAGYTRVVELARRAEGLSRHGWPSRVSDGLELLGEDGEHVKGLLRRRPSLFAGMDEDGQALYREFKTEAELGRAELALDMAEVLGRLFFDAFGLSEEDIERLRKASPDKAPTFTDIFLAALGRAVSGSGFGFAPLSREDAEAYIGIVFDKGPPPSVHGDVARQLEERTAAALGRLAAAGERDEELARRFVRESLFRLEEEAGRLDGKRLDPRYLGLIVSY